MSDASLPRVSTHRLTAPFSKADLQELRAGDKVLISGELLGARDAAHKRIVELLESGEDLPVDLRGQAIYYVGPSPAAPGRVIGAAGPTTSGRMDSYTPRLLDLGVLATIGKGRRSPEVVAAMNKNGAVYLGAVGGTGALLSRCISAVTTIAWPELGPEALIRLTVTDFPVVVINDTRGGSLY